MGNADEGILGQDLVVRVTEDGSIKELKYPVKAKKVMSLYPNYLVVHCSTTNPSVGQQRAVSVVDLEEFLLPGQAYILYPIPPQLKESFGAPQPHRTSVSRSSSTTRRGLPKKKKRMMPSWTRLQRSLRIKVLVRHFLDRFKGHSSESENEIEASAQLLKPSHNEDNAKLLSKESQQKKKKKAMLTLEPYVWRPALDCIPESPRIQNGRAAPGGQDLGMERSKTPPISYRSPPDVTSGFERFFISQPAEQSNGFDGFHCVLDQNRGEELRELDREPLLRGSAQY